MVCIANIPLVVEYALLLGYAFSIHFGMANKGNYNEERGEAAVMSASESNGGFVSLSFIVQHLCRDYLI